jgi:hypothetical protein
MPSTAAVAAELETVRGEIRSLASRLRLEDLTREGAPGRWSVKDVIAHFAEWDRWNLAQYRAAFQGGAPYYDGRRPEYPPEFERVMPADQRNEMIYEAARHRSVEEVLEDFNAVVDGFLAWLRGRPDRDMAAELGLDFDDRDGSGRMFRLVSEMPQVPRPLSLAELLLGDDPDASVGGHWRHHLPELRGFGTWQSS